MHHLLQIITRIKWTTWKWYISNDQKYIKLHQTIETQCLVQPHGRRVVRSVACQVKQEGWRRGGWSIIWVAVLRLCEKRTCLLGNLSLQSGRCFNHHSKSADLDNLSPLLTKLDGSWQLLCHIMKMWPSWIWALSPHDCSVLYLLFSSDQNCKKSFS